MNAFINFHPRAIDFEPLVAHSKSLKQKNNTPTRLSFVTHNRTEDTITTTHKVMNAGILANPEPCGFI
jgi:uridine kinase